MKLTKRESFLLKLVGFLALIAVSYYLVIAPQLEKLADAKLELDEKTLAMSSVELEIQSLSQLDGEINVLTEEVMTLSEYFFPELQLKKLIVIIDEQLRASGAIADSLGFSQLSVVENQAMAESEDNVQVEPQTEDPSPSFDEADLSLEEMSVLPEVQSLSIDMPFTGTYSQVINFIKRLENMNRHLVINSLQMTQGTDGNITGTISLEFYSLNKLVDDPRDGEYLSWPYNTPMGTDNPFPFISTPIEEPAVDNEVVSEELEEETDSEVSEQEDTQTNSESDD